MNFIYKKITPTILLLLIFSACKNETTLPPITKITPQQIIEIPSTLNEISGMIFRNDTSFFAHNDGGQGARIFEVDLEEKKINRNIKIHNATNIDWEDMTQDDEYIYVADSGNFLGQRTDLKIYKISKNELENQDSVTVEIIEFEYPDQPIFSPTEIHNFECEALLNFENELFLFSKNHLDLKTKWYSLPKNAGNYSASLIQEFESDGLITGATMSEDKDVIALLGYQENAGEFEPFIWLLYDFCEGKIFDGKTKKLDFTFNAQFESICFGRNKNLYFSHESETGNLPQFIYHINIEPFLN